MSQFRRHLEKLRKVKRKEHHPLIHAIHKKYNISKKTLFYVKEYGSHTNVPLTIIKESLGILILAAIISSAGGLAIERIKNVFIAIVPLIILLPTMNDMIGDYGTIISSRLSAMLHEGTIGKKWWLDSELMKLFKQVLIISLLTTLLSSAAALFLSAVSGYHLTSAISLKIMAIAFIDVSILVTILFFTAVMFGMYLFKVKEDPNNFLITITTSIADFGNMMILALLVTLLF
jgi:cation transporter-like permease